MNKTSHSTTEELKQRKNDEIYINDVNEYKNNLVTHTSLPTWLSDNQYLIKCHRPQIKSVWTCFLSIFHIHSETLNIWSHLLGSIMYLTVAICYVFDSDNTMTTIDKLVFSCFFCGAVLCLSCSWLFHTLLCYSQKISLIFNKLDYCGISFLVMGSFIPWLYYSFYCDFTLKLIYMTSVFVLSLMVIIASMFDRFATPTYRPIRAIIFVALGLSAVIPVFHGIAKYGIIEAYYRMALGWTVLMAICYISGATLYACRVPERFFPGRCDIIFQSHQILHICVILGIVVHHYGLQSVFMLAVTQYDCIPIIKVTYS